MLCLFQSLILCCNFAVVRFYDSYVDMFLLILFPIYYMIEIYYVIMVNFACEEKVLAKVTILYFSSEDRDAFISSLQFLTVGNK